MTSRRSSPRGQRGAGLMEVLIASAVMAPLILAAAVGLLTGMRASSNAEVAQRLDAATTTATENLKSLPYVPCGTAEDYQQLYSGQLGAHASKVRADQRDPEPRILAVRYWDDATTSYVPECATDGGAQRFTLSVTIDDRSLESSIVTRNPDPVSTVLELRR